MLKIDVEGAEVGVLQGARRVLDRERPDLLIEVSSLKKNRALVWAALDGLDYRGYQVMPGASAALRPVTSRTDFLKTAPSAMNADFLFLGMRSPTPPAKLFSRP